MVRLRAHHLLCLLTYAGRGYSEAFVRRADALAARLSAGEPALIVEGPDDMCAPLLHDAQAHCLKARPAARDRRAAADVAALLGRPVGPGDTISFDASTLDRLRRAFAEETTRAACQGCPWQALCTSIAGNGYRNARIGSERPAG